MSTARNYIRANKTLFVTLLLVLSLGVANAAFTPAPANPPANNTPTPLNVSATAQTKLGKITVGDATTQGTNMLDVQGRIKMVDGNQAAGKVLTSDATGLATWQNATSSVAAGVDGPSFSAYRTAATGLSLPAGETVVAFDTVTAPTALNNTDPCIASSCPNGPWGYRTSDNTFKPSVPGRYLLSASARIWVAANFQAELRLYKNSTLIKKSVLQDVSSQVYETLTVTAVVDSAAGDTFSLRVYNPSTAGQVYLYSDVNGNLTFFTGSRVGNPATVVEGNTYPQPDIVVPSKAVLYFDLPNTAANDCPTGWSEYATGTGRYVVGLNQGGIAGAIVGTALTSQENRNYAGPHTHTTNIDHYHSFVIPDHTHGYTTVLNYNGHSVANGSQSVSVLQNPYVGTAANTGGSSIGNYGTFTAWMSGTPAFAADYNRTTNSISNYSANTNSPYVQLLMCKKN